MFHGLRQLVRTLHAAPDVIAKHAQWDADWIGRTGAERAEPAKRLAASAPLRIVFVTPYQFMPVQHGGGTLIYHAMRELHRRGNEISVVGFVDSQEWVDAAAPLREFCAEVQLLVRPQRALAKERRRAAPLGVALFEMPELRSALDEVIARRDPDVLQIEYTQLASFGAPAPRAVSCVTAHDVAFVSQYRRALAEADAKAAKEAHAEYLRMFHHELTALARCDVVFPVSAHDGALLGGYLGRSTHVSSATRTGIEVDRLGKLTRRPEPASLLFIGFFPHAPNADAITWYAREVLPRVHRVRPDVTLTIVGAEPPEAVRALAADPRVTVRGFVDDLDAEYARATALVAPIRQGAGVRIKILEAFAASVPVLATRIGAEGIDARDGEHIMLGDTPDELAEKTLALLDAPALQARLSAAGRELVRRTHAWPAVAEAMEGEYRRALRRKGLMEGGS